MFPRRHATDARSSAWRRSPVLRHPVGIEEGGRRVERCPVEGEIDKGLRQRLAAGQSNLAGSAAIVIDDEALEDVVDLVERHVEGQCRVAVDSGLIFEIADTAARQHDPLEREIGGIRRPYQGEKSRQVPPSNHRALLSELNDPCQSLWRFCGETARFGGWPWARSRYRLAGGTARRRKPVSTAIRMASRRMRASVGGCQLTTTHTELQVFFVAPTPWTRPATSSGGRPPVGVD